MRNMLNAISCSWKRDLVLEDNEDLSAVIEYRYSEPTDAEIGDRALRPRRRQPEINSAILGSVAPQDLSPTQGILHNVDRDDDRRIIAELILL